MSVTTAQLNTEINNYIVENYTNSENRYVILATGINEKFDYPINSEAVRKRCQILRKKGLIESTVPPVGSKFGNQLVELTYEQKVEAQRLKLLQSQQDQQERAEIRDDAKHANLVSVLQQAVTPLQFEYTPLLNQRNYANGEESAVLVISDTHFGKKTSCYNMEIALKRFIQLIDNALGVLAERDVINPIKEIHIMWTGDIVDGEQIYKTHGSHIDTHVVNQIFKSIEIVAPQITRFVDAGYTVHNHFVRGNHGRVSHFHNEVTNWDYIYGLTLQMAMKEVPNLHFNVCDGWQQIVEVQGKHILQFHGHQIKMQLNLPWYSLTTRINRWATTKTLENFDITVSGHFHSSSYLSWNEKKVFTNGTLVAGDQFALEYLGLEATECQHFFGVNRDKGVTWHYELDFSD